MGCQLVIGREGVTAPVIAELEKLFARHELIKVKLLAERDERPALCAAVEEKTGAAEAGCRAALASANGPLHEAQRFVKRNDGEPSGNAWSQSALTRITVSELPGLSPPLHARAG